MLEKVLKHVLHVLLDIFLHQEQVHAHHVLLVQLPIQMVLHVLHVMLEVMQPTLLLLHAVLVLLVVILPLVHLLVLNVMLEHTVLLDPHHVLHVLQVNTHLLVQNHVQLVKVVV